eukprot:5583453-Amphidinium_carterae.1
MRLAWFVLSLQRAALCQHVAPGSTWGGGSDSGTLLVPQRLQRAGCGITQIEQLIPLTPKLRSLS